MPPDKPLSAQSTDDRTEILARMAALMNRETCFCGKVRGHAGWLLCAFPDRAESDQEQAR